MSRFLDVTYSEEAVLGLIDRTFIVAILILVLARSSLYPDYSVNEDRLQMLEPDAIDVRFCLYLSICVSIGRL